MRLVEHDDLVAKGPDLRINMSWIGARERVDTLGQVAGEGDVSCAKQLKHSEMLRSQVLVLSTMIAAK